MTNKTSQQEKLLLIIVIIFLSAIDSRLRGNDRKRKYE